MHFRCSHQCNKWNKREFADSSEWHQSILVGGFGAASDDHKNAWAVFHSVYALDSFGCHCSTRILSFARRGSALVSLDQEYTVKKTLHTLWTAIQIVHRTECRVLCSQLTRFASYRYRYRYPISIRCDNLVCAKLGQAQKKLRR